MNQPLSKLSPVPTNVRYGVLGFACTLSMITYLDRVCFGAAVPHIIGALKLTSEADLKWAQSGSASSTARSSISSARL